QARPAPRRNGHAPLRPRRHPDRQGHPFAARDRNRWHPPAGPAAHRVDRAVPDGRGRPGPGLRAGRLRRDRAGRAARAPPRRDDGILAGVTLALGLRAQLLLALVVVTLGAIASVGAIAIWQTRGALASDQVERAAAMAQVAARLVENGVDPSQAAGVTDA